VLCSATVAESFTSFRPSVLTWDALSDGTLPS
jgi:hypothetical protein